MKYILSIFLFFPLNWAFGQTAPEHPIDVAMQKCLDGDENTSTQAITDCVVEATEKWDKLLNKNYQTLLSLLNEEQKIKLKTSQRQWINYRDREIEFSDELYGSLQGTMWIPISAETKLELTKQRALELEAYITHLSLDE